MDYLCSETAVTSPVSGIVLNGQCIVTFHHATLHVFDHNFNLIRERYLYERILAIRKLGEDQLIVLFRGSRSAQMTFELETVALRIVEGASIDVHTISGGDGANAKNLAVVWDRTKATVFSAQSEEQQIVRFSKLEIRNVTQVVFLRNYIPTLLVLWRTTAAAHCALIALDGVEIVESFDVIDGVISMHSLGRFIVFLSRHFIQIRFKREISTLELGPIAAPHNASIIYRVIDHPLESIALENPQVLLRGDVLVLINGDGSMYRIRLSCDATRITDAEIIPDGRTVAPSCVDICGDMCAIGSVDNMTLLCTFGGTDGHHISTSGSSRERPLQTPSYMPVVSVRRNDGCITSMYAQRGGDFVFTTKSKTLHASSIINFQAHEKIKLSFQPERLFARSDGLYADGPRGTVQLTKSEMQCPPYTAVMDNEGVLSICAGGVPIDRIRGVLHWHFDKDLVVYTTAKALVVYSMSTNKKLLYSGSIYTFEDKVVNEHFATTANLTEIIGERPVQSDEAGETEDDLSLKPSLEVSTEEEGFIAESGIEEKSNGRRGDEIIEVLIKADIYPFVFLRTTRQLFLYRMVDNALCRVFVPRYLAFDMKPSMFCMGSCVYLRSRTPYLAFLTGGVYMHRTNCRFTMGVADGDVFYFVYKGHLIKTRLPGMPDTAQYHANFIMQDAAKSGIPHDSGRCSRSGHADGRIQSLSASTNEAKRVKLGENEATGRKDVSGQDARVKYVQTAKRVGDEHLFDDSIVIQDGSPDTPSPRRLAYSRGAVIVAVARYIPFTYIPFVPMVHISHGPGSAPVSEPINKEQETFSGPLVLGRTLKYSLELRSQNCNLYHVVELEDNELVCDLKVLLDGLIVVCTSFPEGEEKAVRGRIIVYAIRDVVPDPRFPWRDKQLCVVASEPVKAPCLGAAEVRGLLAVCVGTRLMIYDVDTTTGTTAAHRNTGLSAVGRNEIALLTVGIVAVENFIAVVDRHRGVRLFFLRPRDPLRLHLLSQGSLIPRATHIQYIIYRPAQHDLLSFVVRDVFGSLHIYTYSPLYPLSGNGTRLTKRAEIRTGIMGDFTDSAVVQNDSHSYSAAFVSNSILLSVCAMKSSRALPLQSAIASHIIGTGGIDVRNYLEPEGYVNMECREVASCRMLLEFFSMDIQTQNSVLQMGNLTWGEAMAIYNMIFTE